MLHLKKIEDSSKVQVQTRLNSHSSLIFYFCSPFQMVVRAETNLGNILLNVLLHDKLMLQQSKNNVQFFCAPNPPIKDIEPGKPIRMLVKVKSEDMAKELLEKLEELAPK